MGTGNAFYVRLQANEAALTNAIRAQFPDAEIEMSPDFAGVLMPTDAWEPPVEKLTALSLTLQTDVFWLGFQSVVDAFDFYHWRSGESVRTLVYGCYEAERTWERVGGQPEPWEKEVFFSQRSLEHAVKCAGSDAERQELQRIWRDGEIVPGRTEPGFDARDSAHKIAAYYKFPHYG